MPGAAEVSHEVRATVQIKTGVTTTVVLGEILHLAVFFQVCLMVLLGRITSGAGLATDRRASTRREKLPYAASENMLRRSRQQFHSDQLTSSAMLPA